MRWVVMCGLLGLVGGASVLGCGSECSEGADCNVVVCPDLTEHQICKEDGTCFTIEDCDNGPGGGW